MMTPRTKAAVGTSANSSTICGSQSATRNGVYSKEGTSIINSIPSVEMDCLDSRSAPLRVPVLVAQHGLDALLEHPRHTRSTWSVVTLVPSAVRNTTRDKQVSTARQGNGVHCRRALRHRCLSGSPSTQMSGAGSGVFGHGHDPSIV